MPPPPPPSVILLCSQNYCNPNLYINIYIYNIILSCDIIEKKLYKHSKSVDWDRRRGFGSPRGQMVFSMMFHDKIIFFFLVSDEWCSFRFYIFIKRL